MKRARTGQSGAKRATDGQRAEGGPVRSGLNNIPTAAEGLAFERFHSVRIGWTDGANGAPKQEKFTQHATRPDLTALYLKGFAAGEEARNAALRAAAAEVGYVPNILR